MSTNSTQDRNKKVVAQVLAQLQTSPSASHDDTVLGTADRLLGNPRAATHRRWQVPAALAASLLLAVPIALQVQRPTAAPIVRAAASATVPQTGQLLSAVPQRLQWPAVAGASGYRVTLRDASAAILWTSEQLEAPGLSLPEAAAEAIAGLDTCIWSVEVIGPIRRQQLGPFWFHFATP